MPELIILDYLSAFVFAKSPVVDPFKHLVKTARLARAVAKASQQTLKWKEFIKCHSRVGCRNW